MEDIIQLFEELPPFNPIAVATVSAGIAVFIIELILYNKGLIFSSGEKRLERAKKNGYFIIAHRTFINFDDQRNDAGRLDRTWCARYEYEFRGIRGSKTVISHHGRPAPTLTLYHDGKSSKVYTEAEMRKHKQTILIYVIPIVVMILVAKLLGFQP
jgi:hypothetical protein